MEKVKEFMDIYSQEIIRELGKKEFNTTDVVSTIIHRKEWQKEYIKLSEQYGSYNELNAQIGRYLLNNQKKLKICKNGGKEESIAITKRLSSNQKWRLLFIPFLLFVSISAYAQTLSPQKNSKSKWGYVNEIGKTVIKYKYDEARGFSEELAAVAREGKWGYIDKKGKLIIPLIYDGVGDFSEGLATVATAKDYGIYSYGYIDKTGKMIIPMKYTDVKPFSEGMAKVAINGSWNPIDKTWGFIDKTGKEIIPVKYNEIGDFSEEGLAKVKSSNYWGFIDKTGKEIIPVKYYVIGNFSEEGVAKVQRGNYWGFIDKTGEEIIPIKYEEIGEFSKEGLARVKRGYKFGFIDKTGKEIISAKYSDVSNFTNGYAAVKSDSYENKIWGIIDNRDTEILPKEYLESEVLDMLSDHTLLQKAIQHVEDRNNLIAETESVLDNDYYSNNCHSEEVLDRLYIALDKMENELPSGSENKKYLSELKKGLVLAYRQQTLTKKYGVTTAKKIIGGKYEIGMSKEVVYEILSNNRGLDMRGYYEKSESSSSETWIPKWVDSFSVSMMNLLGIDRPTLIIRNGKLTDIIR